MGKIHDLTGMRFGRLTVLSRAHNKKYLTQWFCVCECGAEVVVYSGHLKDGHTQSCGCIHREMMSETRLVNLTGMRFGRLFVLERVPSHSNDPRWKCLCDCGAETIVTSPNLKEGHTQSCGCLHREITSEKNFVDLTGKQFGRLIVLNRVSNRNDKVCWLCRCSCGNETIVYATNLSRGDTRSCGCLQKEITTQRTKGRIGALSYGWKGGVSVDERGQRVTTAELRRLSHECFKRDNFKCVKCKKSARQFNAHHIKSWKRYPESRLDLDNLATLCVLCHREFHKLYGVLKFTPENFYEWIGA